MPALLLLAVAFAGCTSSVIDAPVRADSGGGTATVDMQNIVFAPTTLTVAVGTTVTWVNKDVVGHTVTPTDSGQWGTAGSGDDPADWMMEGDRWSHTFSKPGTYQYYCLPHASQRADGSWAGMVATVIVTESASASSDQGDSSSGSMNPMLGPLAAARPVDVAEIGLPADAVPRPLDRDEPASVTFDITSREVTAELADGSTYEYWTFDGTVPGPMLRVREGDTVTINHHNAASSTMPHNIDFHAVTGPGGGAPMLSAPPGETATLTWKALRAGLYIYHCAQDDPPLHIARGMYGLILVEPEGGLPEVDHEFVVVQGELYSTHSYKDDGHHVFDGDKADDERPSFVVFNGRVGSLTDDRQMQVRVGDSVRMFVGNGGPNLVSSFHIIGEIFDRVWSQGSLTSEPLTNVQTTLVPAGGAVMVEFDVEVPGPYFLVDHSINRVHKGAFGVLTVEGEDAPETYREGA